MGHWVVLYKDIRGPRLVGQLGYLLHLAFLSGAKVFAPIVFSCTALYAHSRLWEGKRENLEGQQLYFEGYEAEVVAKTK